MFKIKSRDPLNSLTLCSYLRSFLYVWTTFVIQIFYNTKETRTKSQPFNPWQVSCCIFGHEIQEMKLVRNLQLRGENNIWEFAYFHAFYTIGSLNCTTLLAAQYQTDLVLFHSILQKLGVSWPTARSCLVKCFVDCNNKKSKHAFKQEINGISIWLETFWWLEVKQITTGKVLNSWG